MEYGFAFALNFVIAHTPSNTHGKFVIFVLQLVFIPFELFYVFQRSCFFCPLVIQIAHLKSIGNFTFPVG